MSEHAPDPDDLTSPGTIDDPELERKRAEEARERELESRESSGTKYDEQAREEQAERAEIAEELQHDDASG
jgi:hypothetical protein